MKKVMMLMLFLFVMVLYVPALELILEKTHTIQDTKQGVFITHDEDYFYITDWGNTSLNVYDRDFNLKGQLLSQGRGPGEISGRIFYPAVSPEGVLYVFDPMMSRFHVYRDMEYEDTHNLGIMVNRFVFIDEDSAIFSLLMDPARKVLAQLNVNSGEVEKEFSYTSEEKGASMVIEGQFSMLKVKDSLFLGYLLKNKLVKYSLSRDTILKEAKLPLINEVKSSENPIAAIYTVGMSYYKNRILILASDPKGKKIGEGTSDLYFYLYDEDLSFIERVKSEEKIIAYCLKDDRIFTLCDGKVCEYSLKL